MECTKHTQKNRFQYKNSYNHENSHDHIVRCRGRHRGRRHVAAAALLILLAAVLLASCGAPSANNPAGDGTADETQAKDDRRPNVVATIFPPYDFARQVAGGLADVTMLLPPAAESHSFEPTPRDILTIQDCDLFLYVGGESDAWVQDVLASMDTSGMQVVTLMDCVEPVEEEIVEGMQEEEEEADEATEEEGDGHEAELDEHVWTAPQNAVRIVQKISDALCAADAAHAEDYAKNAAAYIGQLDTLDASFQDVVTNAKRRTIVFADRFPFRYFADAYGLSYRAAFPGCSTESEASASTVAGLIDFIRDEKIPAVFHIELSNKKLADAISEQTGAKVLQLHSCHNISKED
ncbi:MAG: metal ABC transporter substrate-binding protein, partial [Clostridiales Family XIII bacterium]|nr:metal ABC transporter substrate-binding protein [Clostridiales Family XIII bacterium]